MDFLVEKTHYTRLNAINKIEFILAKTWFCMLDKSVSTLRTTRSVHFDTFYNFFAN
jgi:hypothetical protein